MVREKFDCSVATVQVKGAIMTLERFVDKLRDAFPPDTLTLIDGDVVLELSDKTLTTHETLMPWSEFLAIHIYRDVVGAIVEGYDGVQGGRTIRFYIQSNVQLLLW